MRLLVLGIVLLVLSVCPLQAQIESDKLAHFGVGVFSGAVGALVVSELTERNRFWTITGSIASSLLAGLAKEALDERNSGSWDNADLGATVLGGVTVGITIELVSKKDGKRYRGRRNRMSEIQNNSATVEFLLLDAKYDLINTSQIVIHE